VDFDAVVLAGGRAERLDGADKAALDVAGATLLDHALRAVAGARRIVVVGDERPTDVPVVWTREQPAYGGPVAAAYAGLDALRGGSPVRLSGPEALETTRTHGTTPVVVVVAVDMPAVTAETVGRLVLAAEGRDGAVLVDGGRRHLAMAVTARALDAVRPDPVDGAAMRGLWEALDLADVPALEAEAGDVDSWADLAEVAEVLAGLDRVRKIGSVNLHDWIDELCDVLDIDTEVDEALVLDLAKVVADNVVRKAAPISTYLLGDAAGLNEANPVEVEKLAAKAQLLAEGWDRPRDAKDPVDIDDAVPDDSTVDHTGDRFEDE
jgi:molybdopterin-guanine dinucleotide biosynthesis protein A